MVRHNGSTMLVSCTARLGRRASDWAALGSL
jgi:hypothetical protein